MWINQSNMNTPFSELLPNADNPETPRQFIRNSEIEFGIAPADLDSMSEQQLNDYIDHLDDLWGK